ncbi:MAG: TRAP transporter small permease [Rhodospirillales bacterium]|nr:TRAP transporter small permease [Rhodospirillales bacterium]
MDRILKWLEWPIHIFLWVGLLAGALMMFHVSADVAGRTIFNSPLIGTNEIVSGYYMVAAAYLPWAYIAKNDDHIAVELFVQAVPARIMVWLELILKALTVAYVCVFAYQTFFRAIEQTRAGEALEVGGAYMALWPSRYLLPLAGALMIIYLVVRIFRDFGRAMNKDYQSGKG